MQKARGWVVPSQRMLAILMAAIVFGALLPGCVSRSRRGGPGTAKAQTYPVSAKRFRFWNTSTKKVPAKSLRLREQKADQTQVETHLHPDAVPVDGTLDTQPSNPQSSWRSVRAEVEVTLNGMPLPLAASVSLPTGGVAIQDIWAHVYECNRQTHLEVGGVYEDNVGDLHPLPHGHTSR